MGTGYGNSHFCHKFILLFHQNRQVNKDTKIFEILTFFYNRFQQNRLVISTKIVRAQCDTIQVF